MPKQRVSVCRWPPTRARCQCEPDNNTSHCLYSLADATGFPSPFPAQQVTGRYCPLRCGPPQKPWRRSSVGSSSPPRPHLPSIDQVCVRPVTVPGRWPLCSSSKKGVSKVQRAAYAQGNRPWGSGAAGARRQLGRPVVVCALTAAQVFAEYGGCCQGWSYTVPGL